MRELEKEANQMNQFEQQFWHSYQDYQVQLQALGKEQSAVRQKIQVSADILDRCDSIDSGLSRVIWYHT